MCIRDRTEIELGNLVDHKGIFIVEISFDENGIDYVFPDGTESWQKYELDVYKRQILTLVKQQLTEFLMQLQLEQQQQLSKDLQLVWNQQLLLS